MQAADCIIVGGGIAGLSLASALANEMTVCVLEAESAAGYHASGRSVAFAHFGLGERIVRSLTAASLPAFRQFSAPTGAPLTRVLPALHIARAEQAEILADLARVHADFDCTFDVISGAEAQELVPVLNTGAEAVDAAIIDHGALALDTDAMLQRHLSDLRAQGGSFVTGAGITAIERIGDRWRVMAGAHVFEAPIIVNAAGAWADKIATMATARTIGIEPRRRTVISFDGPAETDTSNWPFIKTVAEGFYMLPEGRSRLLASAMDQTPSAACDAAPEELDIAIAADRIAQATTLDIRRIVHSWAGLRSFTPDELPVIGEAQETPGFFWFAGQGGYGFQTSPALAAIGKAAVLGLPFPEHLAALDIGFSDFAPARFAD